MTAEWHVTSWEELQEIVVSWMIRGLAGKKFVQTDEHRMQRQELGTL